MIIRDLHQFYWSFTYEYLPGLGNSMGRFCQGFGGEKYCREIIFVGKVGG
jgi:hypothetical protein